jgi:hypothetical protein
VVGKLLDSRNEADRRLGTYLSCLAWPDGTSPDVRHANLLHIVQRAPTLLAPSAVAALNLDASASPTVVLSTLVDLLQQLVEARPDDGVEQRVLRATADTVWSALAALPLQEPIPEAVGRLLNHIAAVEPGTDLHVVDFIAAEIFKRDENAARRFLHG